MSNYFVIAISLLLVGCSSEPPMTADEREYENAENLQKWEICKSIYARSGQYTISNHVHHRGRGHDPEEVREDLRMNGCGPLLERLEVWD